MPAGESRAGIHEEWAVTLNMVAGINNLTLGFGNPLAINNGDVLTVNGTRADLINAEFLDTSERLIGPALRPTQ